MLKEETLEAELHDPPLSGHILGEILLRDA